MAPPPGYVGHTPHLAYQEIWGLLVVYNTLVDLAVQAATDLGVDPDQICFTTVLTLTRAAVSAETPCAACGHRPSDLHDPGQALTAAIAAYPLNRIGRHRTRSPDEDAATNRTNPRRHLPHSDRSV